MQIADCRFVLDREWPTDLLQTVAGLFAADSRGSAGVTDSDVVVDRLRPDVALSDISRAVALSDGTSRSPDE